MRPKTNRRQWLKRAAGVAAGSVALPYAVASSALGGGGTVAPSNRIAVGCIGLGIRGTTLLKSFLGQADSRVVAVCDVYAPSAKGRADRGRALRQRQLWRLQRLPRAVCPPSDIDAVCVASPDHWHVLHSLEAVRNGKDIYTEKALGLSVAADKALRTACHQYGTVFQWGTQQRSRRELPVRLRAGPKRTHRQAAHDLWLVSPTTSPSRTSPLQPVPKDLDYDMWLGPAPWAPYTYHRCRPWTPRRELRHLVSHFRLLPGRHRRLLGIHHVDIAQWGHGADHTGPMEVEGTATFPERGLADCAVRWKVRHTYADGVTMIYTDNQQNKQGVVFQGTEGWVYVRRGHIDAEPKSLLSSQPGPDEIRLPKSPGHQRNFLDCVKSRKRTISPIEVAVRSDTISQLTDVCTRLKRRIRWDPDREEIVGRRRSRPDAPPRDAPAVAFGT